MEEYIGGLSGSEYYAKVTANRIKTTIRYGRREEVNRSTYVNVYLPESWHGELQLSSQYGDIISDEDWSFDRFAAETMEGSIALKGITAPRIRMSCPVGSIRFDRAEGFVDLHSVSGSIIAGAIAGGAKLETSGGPITAAFTALNNIVECNTLNGPVDLVLPKTPASIWTASARPEPSLPRSTVLPCRPNRATNSASPASSEKNHSRMCASPPSTEMYICGKGSKQTHISFEKTSAACQLQKALILCHL